MSVKNIGDVSRKLEACVRARSAIESAAHAYKMAKILVDQASHAITIAEQVMIDAAAAAEAQAMRKIQAVVDMERGMEDLITDILNAKDIKRGNALDTCIAAREFIDSTAMRANRLKKQAQSAAELESIAQAALSSAQSAWTEKQRIYENAVGSAESAMAEVMNVATIIRS